MEIQLVPDHHNRNISLDIIVQHNSAPKKNRLWYMLKGFNANWNKSGGRKTTATYTNLNPGTYRFLYKGTNGDELASTERPHIFWKDGEPEYLFLACHHEYPSAGFFLKTKNW